MQGKDQKGVKGMIFRRVQIHAVVSALFIFVGVLGSASAKGLPEGSHGHQQERSHGPQPGGASDSQASVTVELLDVKLLDQDNRSVSLKNDVVGDRIVVMNFIYTSCTTQCPLSSQVLAHVQKRLEELAYDRVRLVSLSIDPGTDTPQRLKDYAAKVGAGPGWTWLTGKKPDVERLLTALGVYTPDFKTHPSVFLVGDGKSGAWTRFYGQPTPDQLLSKVHTLVKQRRQAEVPPDSIGKQQAPKIVSPEEKQSKARAYFTDLPVVTHDGRTVRFYSDLLKDKIVLINLFFSNCEKSCPLVHNKIAELQKLLEGELGKSVFFISVTIDPKPDTPEIIKRYAENFNPQEGWSFVTGKPEDIKAITFKLGQIHENIEAHSPFLLVGDVNRVRWKKFLPNVSNELLARFIRMLVADHPSS